MKNTSQRSPRGWVKGIMRGMPRLPGWSRRLGHYGLALLFVAAAAGLRWAIPEVLGPTPFLAFYLAWVGAAVFGGLGPGLLATVASWMCIDLLFDPTNSLASFTDLTAMGRLTVLLAGGLTVSLVADRMRRGRIRERRQSRELARDIIERKRTEERLRESEAQLRTIVENLTEGLVVATLDGRLVHWNHAALEMHEFASLEECQRHLPEFVDTFELSTLDGETLPVEQWPLARILRGENLHDWEVRIRRIDRDWQRIFSYGGSLVRNEQGQRLLAVVTVNDITQRKEAEVRLRRNEEDLNRAQAVAQTGSWRLNVQRNELLWSDETYHLFRIPGGTPMTYETFLAAVHPEDREYVDHKWTQALHGEPYDIEHRILAGSTLKWVREKAELEFDKSGNLLGGFGTIQDITARKLAEGAMQEANERLQQQAEELTTANEELRESEQALRESEEALRELNATLENKVAQRTAELEHRARQLQKLTLELSQAEDRERKRLAEILHDDLQQVLAAAKFHLSLMRNRTRHDPSLQTTATQIDHMLKDAIEKSRSLSHELSPAVLHDGDFAETLGWLAGQVQAKHGLAVHVSAFGEVGSQSDALKTFVYKAAQELLFNVVKHARVKEATIRVRRLGRWICLSVSDRGRGFDPQALNETHGFGLLSIRERVELLGGRMKIKSVKDKGSTFSIVVPDGELANSNVETGPRPNVPVNEVRPAKAENREGGRLRVLLADDHEIVREGLISLLSEEPGLEIVGEAANGREAVDLAGRFEPDVVIMDVSMPLINGDEATRQIKRHLPDTRVVALSMFEDPDTKERMHAAGAEAYVLKTAPSEDLLAAIRGTSSHPSNE